MRLSSKRFTGLIVVIISVLLALTASGFFYYIQINENESYQNQLHFRELNEVSRALGDGLKQLATVAKEDAVTVLINRYTRRVADKISQLIKPELAHFAADSIKNNDDILQIKQDITRLESARGASARKNKSQVHVTIEQPYTKSLAAIDVSLAKMSAQIAQQQRELRENKRQNSDYLDTLISILDTYDEQDLDYIGEQCEIEPSFCQWFETLFEKYLEFNAYRAINVDSVDAAIASKKQAVLANAEELLTTLNKEQNTIDSISVLLKKNIYQLSQKPELAKLLSCQQRFIWQSPLICQRLSESLNKLNQQQSQQHSQAAEALTSGQSYASNKAATTPQHDIKLLQQELEYSKKINRLKIEILRYVSAQLKLPNIQADIANSIKTIKQLENTMAKTRAEYQKIAQNRTAKIVENDKALSYLGEKISSELSDLRSSIAAKQKKQAAQQQALIERLSRYEVALFPAEKSVFEESKDFKVFYDNLKLAFNRLIECIEDNSTKALALCDSSFNKLAELTKPQTLQKLLQSSTYLKNAQIHTANLIDFSQQHNLQENQFNLFSLPEQQNSQVAYFYKNRAKQNQQSLTTVPLVDLLGSNISRFPLILIVDKQGKRLVRKDNSLLGSFQNGLSFDLTRQILKKLAREQNAEDNFYQASGQQIVTNLREQKDKTALSEINEKIETKHTRNGETLPGYSGFIDVRISGQEYRIFISPYQVNFIDARNNQQLETLYLMGFIAKSALVSKKLSISNTAVMISILCLLILMALVPLLKIRLISIQQSFSLADRHWAFIGLGVLAGMLAIAIFDHAFYNHLKHEVEQQSKIIHQEIKHNFKHEISALTTYANNNVDQLNSSNTNEIFQDKSLKNSGWQYFLENLFTLQEDGIFKKSALWSSEQFYRKKAIDLNIRAYFNRAIRCDAWPMVLSANSTQPDARLDNISCKNQLFMQRIFNVRDSRKTTQFSMPMFDKKVDNNKEVMAFGTRMQSFFAPLLPKHFGFLVFDNDSGEVLYHSDDERSLLENIYIETDNNPKLLKLVANANLTSEENYFTSSYRGKTHLFRAGRLAKNIPWTLAIFYDKSQLRTLNMLTVFTAISCFMLLALLTYIIIAVFSSKQFLPRLCWFNDKIQSRYQAFAIQLLLVSAIQLSLYILLEKYFPWLHSLLVLAVMVAFSSLVIFILHRQISTAKSESDSIKPSINIYTDHGCQGYNRYILALLIYFYATPAILLCMASAGYYLEKHAVIHAIHLNQKQQDVQAEHQNYYDLVLDKDSVFKLNAEILPCYLGVGTGLSNRHQAITCDNAKQSLNGTDFWFGKLIAASDKKYNNNNVFDLVWHIIPLNFPFAQETWLLSSLTETQFEWSMQFASKHNRILLNALWANFYSVLLSVLLAIAWLYWLIQQWLSKRLIGTNVPTNFRLNDSKRQTTEEKVKLLFKHLAITQPNRHRGRFMQIIRPTNQLFSHFSSDEKNKYHTDVNNLFLTTNHAIAISQLTDSRQNIEHHVKHLLKVDGTTSGKTVIIKKLEMVALDAKQRLKALETLEYIVELGNVNIILLADITPLYRLTKQVAYPNDLSVGDYANSHETVRWARLMKRFVKFYDWTPVARSACQSGATSAQVLAHEAMSWPECQRLQQDFYDYHLATKATEIKCLSNKYYDRKGKEIEKNQLSTILANSINQHWSSDQIIEFFNANSGASYRYRWELCTKAERLLMIQLANGYSPNPCNLEPLEHLIRRGYIFQDNGWHLINHSFKRFILSAESDAVVSSWLDAAMESNWQYVRIPLFTLVLVAIGVLAYSASEAVESLMAILTGVLSITPLLLRSFSLFKGPSNADNP